MTQAQTPTKTHAQWVQGAQKLSIATGVFIEGRHVAAPVGARFD